MNQTDTKSLKIRVFATLRSICSPETIRQFPQSATILNILEILGIPSEKVAIVFINNRHAELDSIPEAGDDIGLFPPVGGG